MNKKLLISAAAAAALLLGVSACGNDSDSGSDGSSASEKSDKEKSDKKDDQAAPKPDLKGIPAVVAKVNGQEISKDEFVSIYQGQFQQQAMAGGEIDQDQLKKQTANTMVETELLVQEASSNGFEATDKDIDNELKTMAKQNGMKLEQFLEAMSQQGMDEQTIRAQLQDQIRVVGFVEKEAGDVKPSEKELRDYYDELAKQQKQQSKGQGQDAEIPPFKDVKKDLEQQLVGQKQSEFADNLVKDLKKDADIDINV